MDVFVHKERQRYDLVYPAKDQLKDETEEVVLSLQGYLVQADLPPILTEQRCVALWVQRTEL